MRAANHTNKLTMYSHTDVARCHNPSLLTNYNKRYQLFSGAILAPAVAGILVPLIARCTRAPHREGAKTQKSFLLAFLASLRLCGEKRERL